MWYVGYQEEGYVPILLFVYTLLRDQTFDLNNIRKTHFRDQKFCC